MRLTISTDGACRGNPGPGSWAFCVFDGTKYLGSKSGYSGSTTNNKMELRAIVEAMSWASTHSKSIKILTDSNYCYKGITEWLTGWIKKNWKTASGSPVKNFHIWKQVDMLLAMTDCTFEKVKGHSDNIFNNKADEICNIVLDKNN